MDAVQRQDATLADESSPVVVEALAFDDIDDLAAAAEGFEQSYLQLTRGSLHAELSFVQFPGFIIGRERANRSLSQQLHIDGRQFMIGESGLCDGRTRVNGRACASNTLGTLSESEELLYRPSDDFDLAYVLIDMDLLSDMTRTLVHRDLVHELNGVHILQHAPHLNAELGAFVRTSVARVIEDPTCFASAAMQRDVFAELVSRFVRVMDSTTDLTRKPPPALKRRRQIVTDIQTFVRSHPRVPLTTVDLCRIAHASARSIEYAFRYCYDMSPAAYLKLLRLHAVWRALRSTQNENAHVKDLANGFGFQHMGHFGRDYKQLFSESPSTTLRRAA